jgi:hypothetical protein
MMPKHAERNTKDSKNPEAQHVTALKVTPPSPMALEQVKNVKMQLTVNIKTNASPTTNISQPATPRMIHRKRIFLQEGATKGNECPQQSPVPGTHQG